MPRSLNWKIAGVAGDGIKSVGEIMAKALLRSGLFVFGYTEYPSLIRGGHNTYQIWASTDGASAPRKEVDVLVALNQAAIDLHVEELSERSVVLCDEELDTSKVAGKVIGVKWKQLVRNLGNPLVSNSVALGLSAAEMGLDREIFISLLNLSFANKPTVVEINVKAFEEGYKLHPNPKVGFDKVGRQGYVITGNEAVGLGAIAAGLQLYAGYPMTPTTTLLHFLAEHQADYGYIVRQTEDELSAINAIIGAAYAGAKVMTATSGGGFDLMQEGLSLAGMLELPVVVDLGMRPGPATGLPTWTSQSDLRLAIHSGHGEFPKIVLAPGDAQEAYELAHQAFLLAQKYQVPVVLLTDKHLNESHYTVDEFKPLASVPLMNITFSANQPEGEMFHRFQPVNDGVSERTLPGMVNGFYIANSDEHGATGVVDESLEMRQVMNRRRVVKFERIRSEVPRPGLYGDKKADLTIVGWGSVKGSVIEALKGLPGVNFVHFTQVWPIGETAKSMLDGKRLVFIENNLSGQFRGLIKQELGIDGEALLKDDGRPFYPEEIIDFMTKLKK